MKLVSIERAQLPYESSALALRLVFERDGKQVAKVAAVSGLKAGHNDLDELKLQCSRVAREADRDLAFLLHGGDFRKHCLFQSEFWGPRLKTAVDAMINGR